MDLRFSPELEQWRLEVRRFLETDCPPESCFDPHADEDDGRWKLAFQFNKKIGKTGWIGVDWPTEYGGMGRPRIYKSIMMQEIHNHRAPLLNGIGWGLAAGLFLGFGSEDQRHRFLPPIIHFETYWAEGLSEPEAGSDLASIQTTAKQDGDHWVINGQKTFISWVHRADVLYLAARTDPNAVKHRGISIFCVDAKLPGITMRPMPNLEGGLQNHLYLDNVRVPLDMLLGEQNMGWHYIMNTFYGGGGGPDFHMENVYKRLVDYCKKTYRNGRPLSKDPLVRRKLAELAVGLETLKMVSWDSLYRIEKKVPSQLGGALGVVFAKEFLPRFSQTCMEILGPLGQLQSGPWAPLAGDVEHLFRQSFRNHAGGTSQVKRMVMATRGLGLPR